VLLAPALILPAAPAPKVVQTDWPMLGGTPARNMVNLTATGLSHEFPPGTGEDGQLNRVLGGRLKWKATLGSRAYGGPVVLGDRVLVGTNNENPRNDRDRAAPSADDPDGRPWDMGVVMCFRASDGQFLWQMVHDKLASGNVNDWPREGVCSTPTLEGDRAYYVSNRAEVVCLDLNGFANGNDGFQGERYRDPSDGDVIWSFDMMKEQSVFPHNMAACSPLIVGDLLFVCTSNGVDENHTNIPFPDAPSFICLSKHTGRLIWKSNLPGKNIMHSQWSSPAYGVIGGRPQVIFAGGDGWLYAFEPDTGKLIWKFDCNPKSAKYELGAKGDKSDFIALPVVYKERVYIGTGQDPEHLEGVGHFWCVDPAGKEGDISPELIADARTDPPGTKLNPNSGLVWHYGGADTRPYAKRDYIFSRTLSTACVVDDVVYIAELAGYVQCLDARTGRKCWQWDTKSNIWGSCYYADGKVFIANEDGDLYIFKHDKAPEILDEAAEGSRAAAEAAEKARAKTKDEANVRKAARDARDAAAAAVRQRVKDKYLLQTVEIGEAIRTTPVVVGDTLYLMTEKTLYAIKAK
jgi:outer membrane protein assembly factor BamB